MNAIKSIAYMLVAGMLLLPAITGCSGKINTSDDAAYTDLQTSEDSGEVKVSDLSPGAKKTLQTPTSLQFDPTKHDSEEIRSFLKFYTSEPTGRRTFEHWLENSSMYLPYVREVFAKRDLPEDLIYVPFIESGYTPRAVSRAGAKGIWQFMPQTGRRFGLQSNWFVDERFDPYKATHAAADYLTWLYDYFDDWCLALAAYNAGEGRVSRAMKKSGATNFFELASMKQDTKKKGRKLYYLPQETRHYVPKIIAVSKMMRNLEELGFTRPQGWEKKIVVESVTIPPRTDLKSLARENGLSWQEFQKYNPAFLDFGSHPDKKGIVYLPADKKQSVEKYLAGNPKPYNNYYSFYTVKKGDSWYNIAKKHKMSLSALKKYNKKTSNLIRPGQKVKVPNYGKAKKVAAKTQKPAKKKTTQKTITHTVIKGDTLWSIARQYKSKVHIIAATNNINTQKVLPLGTRLTIAVSATASAKAVSKKNITPTATSHTPYKVQVGDTFWHIARRFGATPTAIAKANGMKTTSILRPGKKLYIPVQGGQKVNRQQSEALKKQKQSTTYTVKNGDTLYDIALRFGCSPASIQKWNNLASAKIFPGDSLMLFQ